MALKTGRKEYPYHMSSLQDSPKCIDTENRIKSRFLQSIAPWAIIYTILQREIPKLFDLNQCISI